MLSRGKTQARIELVGETHTFADVLRHELSEDRRVKNVSYDKQHPQLGNPILVLETDGEDPVAVAKKAAKNLAERCKEMRLVLEQTVKKA